MNQPLPDATPMAFESLFAWMAPALGQSETAVQNAVWTISVGALTATACALVGCFLLLRRMTLLGDALSHSVLAGIAAAYLLTNRIDPLPMFAGALIAGILTAVATQFIHRTASVPEDASIGIVFTSLFAFGVIVVSRARGVHLDLNCVLFGNLSFAGAYLTPMFGYLAPDSFRTLIPALFLTLILLVVLWKELRLTSFDPTFAMTIGFSAGLIHYLLTTVTAVVTVAAMEVVGLLVVALLIVPACIARMLTDRLGRMLIIAVISGISCTTIGYFLALRWNSSAAGLTAVAGGVELLLALLLAPRYGLLGRYLRTLRLRIRIAAEDVLAGLFRHAERAPAPARRSGSSLATLPLDDCHDLAGSGALGRLAVRWLKVRGMLSATEDRATLTERGHQYAESLVRSHRLWESYLQEHFDLPPDHLHDPAEEMEHYIGPEVQQQILEELDQPDADPHGRDIPHRTE